MEAMGNKQKGKNAVRTLFVGVVAMLLTTGTGVGATKAQTETVITKEAQSTESSEGIAQALKQEETAKEASKEAPEAPEKENNAAVESFGSELEEELYYDSLELMADCIEAEAGNQDLDGKRLVADVILNRVDDAHFPNSIAEVILQAGAFECVTNGSIYMAEPTNETYQAVEMELEERTDNEIIYFNTIGYMYGEPWAKVGDHYFSK